MMSKREIEQGFVDAGWKLDGGFSEHLLIGEDNDLSILAHPWAWETDEPTFELWDGENGLVHWVREIPSPRQAAVLLEEHGVPVEEERSTLHKQ